MLKLLHSFKLCSSPSSLSSPQTSPSSPPSRALSRSLIEDSISTAESLVAWCHPSSSIHDNRPGFDEFLSIIKELQRSMHFSFVSSTSTSPDLIRAQRVMEAAMSHLQKEFRHLLVAHFGSSVGSSSFSSHSSSAADCSVRSGFSFDEVETRSEDVNPIGCPPAVSPADLQAIAECMIYTGYGSECVRIYKAIRRSVIDEELHHLGLERISLHQVQRLDWEVAEIRIRGWIAASKDAVKYVLARERALCDQVFATAGVLRHSCFAEISQDTAADLFKFPEYVAAKCKKSPEKIFLILDLHETLLNLMPEIESIFSHESTSSARSQAVSALLKLQESIQSMFFGFESALQKDPPRSPSRGGGIHPLTTYVMDYVSFVANYRDTLSEILSDQSFEAPSPLLDSSLKEAKSSLSLVVIRIAWIVLVLLCKLNARAELYKNVSLSYLFLANNLHYILRRVRDSALHGLLGKAWIAEHEAKLRQYAGNYERRHGPRLPPRCRRT